VASGVGALAISANPLNWLGGAAQGAAADAFKAVMVGLWSTGLWLLKLAFSIVDAFTSPDVSAHGPLAGALPTTLWLGGSVAVLMLFVQLGAALVRRDGQSLGRVLLGIGQFGVVWVGFLGIGGALILAASGLTHGILGSLLHVGSWSQFSVSDSWPRKVNDATAAGVLGICSLLLLIPAAFGYLLVMLIREASLVILLATTPIAAAGLLSDSTKAWFWKSLRWFISALLIAPAAALILGIGVSLSRGVVQGAGTDTVAATGTAVVGCVLVLIGALCPMTLFKLLAFVDPGTGSGAAAVDERRRRDERPGQGRRRRPLGRDRRDVGRFAGRRRRTVAGRGGSGGQDLLPHRIDARPCGRRDRHGHAGRQQGLGPQQRRARLGWRRRPRLRSRGGRHPRQPRRRRRGWGSPQRPRRR